ncbi:MAG: hypothetical protein DDT34_02401 [Firmicutes bacterium]|nr:hypothetical protein [Bacillota bacterium]
MANLSDIDVEIVEADNGRKRVAVVFAAEGQDHFTVLLCPHDAIYLANLLLRSASDAVMQQTGLAADPRTRLH